MVNSKQLCLGGGLFLVTLPLLVNGQASVPATPPAKKFNSQPVGLQPDPTKDLPRCVTSAPDGYSGKGGCFVEIDRNNPASPTTLIVRGNNNVTIRVVHARGNEVITFTPVTTQVAPVDVAGTFLKNAITPLQGLVGSARVIPGPFALFRENAVPVVNNDPIAIGLNNSLKAVQKVLSDMADATAHLSCLEGYKVVVGTVGTYSCSSDTLTPDTFEEARQTTIEAMRNAAQATLPTATLKDLETQIAADVKTSSGMTGDDKTKLLAMDDIYQSTDTLLSSVISDTQKAQATMFETAQQLNATATAPQTAYFPIKQLGNYNSIVTIAAQEVISKTTTTLATVTINWQANHWIISTGIMFSSLKVQTFTAANLVKNGQPVLDATTQKNITVAQNSYTRPTVVVPLVMANYRLGFLSHFPLENKCPNHCAILLSGGVGLNVPQKNAEFAAGPSFQIGSVIVTPAFHIGRYTDLTNGIGVGTILGINPPSPLPTSSTWTTKFGIAVSWALPFQ